ncbi:MAG TPA: cell division protein FtsA [Verrucomicrobiota bacterium]|nr:cell division protein FtsA [Verrucomicrobiota bacterium]HNT14235.1 cell division protein FtsA [Verrucomicrobiota bacterium]
MFDSSSIIVGLEIGTSKVCAVVGELNEGAAPNIIGVGQAGSRGVRKGEIIDPRVVEEDVRHAIVEAEQMADVEIRSVYLGVSGGHIRGFNNRGMHPVVSADREITQEDVADVVKNAKAINLPQEHTVLHAIRQDFFVDGHKGVKSPVGMLGARLEVDVHVVHGHLNRLQNAIRVVRGIQLEVEEVVFNGLATSLAVLTPTQKTLGALVIDLGAGTTNYAVYYQGVIRHTGVLAVGGDHVTNDLAYGLKVPQGRAEQLKIDHGHAVMTAADEDQKIELKSGHGLPASHVNLSHLRRIMSLRLEEIFELIAQDLMQLDLFECLRAGVVLTGGGARIRGITQLAEQVLGLPVVVGNITGASSLKSSIDQPEFATGIGLAYFGSLKSRREAPRFSLLGGIKQVWGKLLPR